MILTDEEVDKLKGSPDNLANKLEVHRIGNRGRREGDKNIPPLVKDLISTVEGESSEVADAFGISDVSVRQMRKGLTGGGNNASFDENRKELIDRVEDSRIKTAHESALDCLVGSLEALKPRLSEGMKAKDLAKIAEGMVRVVDKLKPRDDGDKEARTKVVIFAPTLKQENHYETIVA